MLKMWVISESGQPDHLWYRPEEGMSRPATEADLTATALACYLDRRAESDNYHHLVGVHAWLAGRIEHHAGTKVASAILRELAEAGGLHRLD